MIAGGISILIIGFLSILGLALCVFWIWMLVSAIQNKGLTDNERLIWILLIIFTHFIGSLLYFLIGHPKRLGPPANPA
jgi:hypothetical protein